MKVYLDNESKDFHKIVIVKNSYGNDIFFDLDTIIDALKAYGYSEDIIKRGFIEKCLYWQLIQTIEGEEDDSSPD